MLDAFEFPPEQQAAFERARRLEWWTIAYLASAILVMYLVLGSSQAMKTAWLEDILSVIPSVVFLIASRFAHKPPNQRFRYGYHRVTSIAFLCASAALLAMGGWLLVDALIKLIKQEHTTIGGITLFGQTFWLGWLMLPALVWSAVPAMILGRMKLPLGRKIHDKVLFAGSDMLKADWMTALAAFVGVLGVGIGWWWADAVAAAIISLSILRDGWHNLSEVVTDLMDEVPRVVDGSKVDAVTNRLKTHLQQKPWVRDVGIRLRENGHVFFGEALITVNDENHMIDKADEAMSECLEMDWRLYDFRVIPTRHISEDGNPKPESSQE